MAHINNLPNEILLHIFSYYLETETQHRFMKTIHKVCRVWKDLSLDSSLWKSFDGTIEFPVFKKLCIRGYLRNTVHVKFAKVKETLADASLLEIYNALPSVKRLDLSNVPFKERFFTSLIDAFPELSEIVIRGSKFEHQITNILFTDVFKCRGENFRVIEFSNINISGGSKLFLDIAKFCPNLEELTVQNLSNSGSFDFPIGPVQQSCPKLKVLRLSYPIRYSSVKSCAGFPELETFTHFSKEDYRFTDNHFLKLLLKSKKLKILDIRGCLLLSHDALWSLLATDLERLFLSRSKICNSKNFGGILNKWSHSLRELDISRTDSESIDDILYSIALNSGFPELESLDTSYTKLGISTLRVIIQNCSKLCQLHLNGCRRIGRGNMKSYYGRQSIEHLLSKLGNEIEFLEL